MPELSGHDMYALLESVRVLTERLAKVEAQLAALTDERAQRIETRLIDLERRR
jgi:hypothetical protein